MLGLSKDGRPIYTPLHSNGQEYAGCDVDVCSGMTINGQYAYVSTLFHPYIMGCYGAGNSPSYRQGCSENPRECGKADNLSIGFALASALLLTQTLF